MGKDKWHNRLHLVALENGIIGNFCSIKWKSLAGGQRVAVQSGGQGLGSQVGELQHYYVSPGFYLWTQGLHNCVDYAFFLFVGIVEGGGEVMATCFDLWGWG